MVRLSGVRIGALTLALAAAALAAYAITTYSARSTVGAAAPLYAESEPLDFADAGVRIAMDDYANTLQDGLEPIVSACDATVNSREIYRVAVISDFDIAVVDITVGGNKVLVDEKAIDGGESTNTPAGWHTVRKQYLDLSHIEAVRDQAARLLSSKIPAAINDRNIDSSEWTIQMCRHGRYHFFQRHTPDRDAIANAPFIDFTSALLALRPTEPKGRRVR